MNARRFHQRIEQLEDEHLAYALATVVLRRAPVSAHLGDRAIVTGDGGMDGFVGGSCSREIVRRQALDAIRTGRARLLQIRSDRNDDEDSDSGEIVIVPMGCASEGAVDVYIEPHLPRRPLIVIGYTPVADALVRLASALDEYRVVSVTAIEELPEALASLGPQRARAVAVVASQGHYDERALSALLTGEPPAFVGLLASRKRAAAVLGALEQEGIARERLAGVHAPVGLDIGARTPGDVAISILAQIVAGGVPPAPIEHDVETHCCHS